MNVEEALKRIKRFYQLEDSPRLPSGATEGIGYSLEGTSVVVFPVFPISMCPDPEVHGLVGPPIFELQYDVITDNGSWVYDPPLDFEWTYSIAKRFVDVNIAYAAKLNFENWLLENILTYGVFDVTRESEEQIKVAAENFKMFVPAALYPFYQHLNPTLFQKMNLVG